MTGTVRQKDYSVPFAANRADPTIYRYEREGRTQYLFIATDDTNKQQHRLAPPAHPRLDTFDGLSDAAGGAQREVDLLTAGRAATPPPTVRPSPAATGRPRSTRSAARCRSCSRRASTRATRRPTTAPTGAPCSRTSCSSATGGDPANPRTGRSPRRSCRPTGQRSVRESLQQHQPRHDVHRGERAGLLHVVAALHLPRVRRPAHVDSRRSTPPTPPESWARRNP